WNENRIELGRAIQRGVRTKDDAGLGCKRMARQADDHDLIRRSGPALAARRCERVERTDQVQRRESVKSDNANSLWCHILRIPPNSYGTMTYFRQFMPSSL